MQFAVRTLAPDMSIASLTVDAQDEADARRQVEARGLYVSAIAPVRAAGFQRSRGGKLSLVLFSQELLALLTAGLGIVEGLEALLEKESTPATRGVLERLLAGLREGKRFSGVLAAQPDLFPPLYIGIVRAAEGTSDLPRALERYIEYQQRIDTVRAKIVSASIYPAILLLVGGGVSLFLMSYVVPRFAEVYQGAGRNLPFMPVRGQPHGRPAGYNRAGHRHPGLEHPARPAARRHRTPAGAPAGHRRTRPRL
jgi:general secretion pathway protein F